MPRKSKEINPFDGGINNYANPRDIEDNESASLYNLSTLKKGELAPLKNWKITELTGTSNYLNTKLSTTKNGLFVYQRDFTTASTPVDGNTTVYLVATNISSNKSKLFLVNSLTQSAVATEVFEFENTSGTVTILPCYVNADGNIRIGDGSFTTKTHFYGALKKYNLGGSVANYNINETNMIGKPAGGNLYTGIMNESASTTTGTVNLHINKVHSYAVDVFNFNDLTDELYPIVIAGNGAYPENKGTSAGESSYPAALSNTNTATRQYGVATNFRKRASNGVWSSTFLYAPGQTSAGDAFLAVSQKSGGTVANTTTEYIWVYTAAQGGARTEGFNFLDKSVYLDIWISAETFSGLEQIIALIMFLHFQLQLLKQQKHGQQ